MGGGTVGGMLGEGFNGRGIGKGDGRGIFWEGFYGRDVSVGMP